MVVGALLLAQLVLPWRPATFCTLRALTGIPCPFCGGTTAAVQLGNGDVLAALRASPLAVAWATGFTVRPLLGDARPRLSRRTSGVLLALALVASEAVQLQRFGLL